MLKNGMKVLVQEDPSIPNVALYTFFHVGSRNEHEGITGLSHFFEHMMFNGAKKYGPGQFDKAMEGAGGNNNAYTSNDMTVYQDWFPSSQLELIFDLEADRVQYLAFDPKIVESNARWCIPSAGSASTTTISDCWTSNWRPRPSWRIPITGR